MYPDDPARRTVSIDDDPGRPWPRHFGVSVGRAHLAEPRRSRRLAAPGRDPPRPRAHRRLAAGASARPSAAATTPPSFTRASGLRTPRATTPTRRRRPRARPRRSARQRSRPQLLTDLPVALGATTIPLDAAECRLLHSFYSPYDFYIPSEVFIVKISARTRRRCSRSCRRSAGSPRRAARSRRCRASRSLPRQPLRAARHRHGCRPARAARGGGRARGRRRASGAAAARRRPLAARAAVSLELRAAEQDVELVSGNATFHIRTLRTEDFPPFPEPDPDTAVALPADAFVSTALKVAGSASRDETRPVLTGILVSRVRDASCGWSRPTPTA